MSTETSDKNVASEKIMSKEAFDELIDNLEVVEKLTLYGRKAIKYHVQKMQQQIEEKDKKIQELEEEKEEIKNLFRIQASIAKELKVKERDKMVRFKGKYYIPDTMTVTEDIGKPNRIDLSYVDVTKFLEGETVRLTDCINYLGNKLNLKEDKQC